MRSQSMRAYRRMERIQRVKQYEHELAVATGASPNETTTDLAEDERPVNGRDRGRTALPQVTVAGSRPKSLVADPRNDIAMKSLDPFETTPLALDNNYQFLFAHFKNEIGPILLPVTIPEDSWASRWIRNAASSPLSLFAVCSHASEHLDHLYDRPLSQASLQLRAATLRYVTKSLSQEINAASDETIGALVLLVANGVRLSTSRLERRGPLMLTRKLLS